MVTLPSNMFSTVTLPATLWFFDKQKEFSDKKNEILFIDARNVFTQVDRAQRKFSEEQIKNLGIITKLYDGNEQAFQDLIDEYKYNYENLEDKEYWQSQIEWLKERFPDGIYQDVIGLCKAVTIEGEDGIQDQDWSLNTGRYIGVSLDNHRISLQGFIENNKNLLEEYNTSVKQIEKIHELIVKKTEELMYTEFSHDGWHIGRVSELGVFKRGKNITAAEMIEGEVPVVSAGLEPSGYHNDYNVDGPSICISASGANAGFVSFWLENIWAADCSYCNDSNYIFYLYEMLHFIQPIITNLQRGSAQPHVYAKDINRIKIVIPPHDVLISINELLKNYHKHLDLLKKQVENKENQISLVLLKLLSGKMDIK